MAKPKTPHKRILLRLPLAEVELVDWLRGRTDKALNEVLVALIRAGLVSLFSKKE